MQITCFSYTPWSILIYNRLGYQVRNYQKVNVMDTMWNTLHPFVQAGIGGVLIGLASWLLLASLGRVAGISGIAASAISPTAQAPGERGWRWAFLLGLATMGALASTLLHTPASAQRPWPLLLAAGLLVGLGTVWGSGCTSGHGVCGMGRRSARSLVATLVFMGAGFATVLIAHYAVFSWT
jgi:uncharacterized protein